MKTGFYCCSEISLRCCVLWEHETLRQLGGCLLKSNPHGFADHSAEATMIQKSATCKSISLSLSISLSPRCCMAQLVTKRASWLIENFLKLYFLDLHFKLSWRIHELSSDCCSFSRNWLNLNICRTDYIASEEPLLRSFSLIEPPDLAVHGACISTLNMLLSETLTYLCKKIDVSGRLWQDLQW